ncbi:hypothetical protein ABT297_12215 [Dactylosporangium sp. NPDC000555]|uniref:hypothetical protein n=1 Tax=Dactylosporangium sp. NPDC000555 TaxID=3154260 RepID=UPI00332EA895
MVTLVAMTALGERLRPAALAGVAVTMAGPLGLALWGYRAPLRRGPGSRRGSAKNFW